MYNDRTEEEIREREERLETLRAVRTRGRFKNEAPLLEVLRDVVDNGAKRYRGYYIDAFSASAFLAVYGALGERCRATLLEKAEKNLLTAFVICFKLIGKHQG